MQVPILTLQNLVIVTVQPGLADADYDELRITLANRAGDVRAAGIIIDVSALDVLDSFATRALIGIAKVARLRGAAAIIVGIQPDVAFAMVQLGLTLEGIDTALDLDEAVERLALADPSRVPRGR